MPIWASQSKWGWKGSAGISSYCMVCPTSLPDPRVKRPFLYATYYPYTTRCGQWDPSSRPAPVDLLSGCPFQFNTTQMMTPFLKLDTDSFLRPIQWLQMACFLSASRSLAAGFALGIMEIEYRSEYTGGAKGISCKHGIVTKYEK